MKIQEQDALLENEVTEIGDANTPAWDDVRLNVAVRTARYAGRGLPMDAPDALESFPETRSISALPFGMLGEAIPLAKPCRPIAS